MQRLVVAVALAGLAVVTGGATLAAQVKTKTETKVDVKGGRDVRLTGCVEPASGPATYMLTGVATSESTPGIVHNYYLVGKTDDLEKHIGHVMEIDGKIADGGKGEVEIETKTKIEREHAPDSKEKTKAEMKAAGSPLPFFEVSSVKMLRATCS